jgi:hypothetical protein
MEKGKQHLSLATTWAYRNMELQKLVPREGHEKGGSKVMGISLGQVMKGQEYRSIEQVKNGVVFFYKLLYRVIAV